MLLVDANENQAKVFVRSESIKPVFKVGAVTRNMLLLAKYAILVHIQGRLRFTSLFHRFSISCDH